MDLLDKLLYEAEVERRLGWSKPWRWGTPLLQIRTPLKPHRPGVNSNGAEAELMAYGSGQRVWGAEF